MLSIKNIINLKIYFEDYNKFIMIFFQIPTIISIFVRRSMVCIAISQDYLIYFIAKGIFINNNRQINFTLNIIFFFHRVRSVDCSNPKFANEKTDSKSENDLLLNNY